MHIPSVRDVSRNFIRWVSLGPLLFLYLMTSWLPRTINPIVSLYFVFLIGVVIWKIIFYRHDPNGNYLNQRKLGPNLFHSTLLSTKKSLK